MSSIPFPNIKAAKPHPKHKQDAKMPPQVQVSYADLEGVNKIDTKYLPKLPMAFVDCEMAGDMDKLVIWGCSIYYIDGDKKPTFVGADIIKDNNGEYLTDPATGKYLFKENKEKWPFEYCDEHKALKRKKIEKAKACDKCVRVKPKKYGKYKTEVSNRRLYQVNIWGYHDELDLLWLMLEKYGIKTVYSHWLSADWTAIFTKEYPDTPLLKVFTQDPDEFSKLLFRGSGLLMSRFDAAPFITRSHKNLLKRSPKYEYKRKAYDYNEKKFVIKKDYPIEWKDSIGLFNCKLSVMGEMCGFPKGETPQKFMGGYTVKQLETMIDANDVAYMLTDCEVIFQALVFFWNILKQDLKYHSSQFTLTAGSLGQQMIAQNHCSVVYPKLLDEWEKEKKAGKNPPKPAKLFRKKPKSWKYVANWPEKSRVDKITKLSPQGIDDLVRTLDIFKGGRTQVRDNSVHTKPVFGIDANQMYCSVQNDEGNAFPNPLEPFTCDNPTIVKKLMDDKEGAVFCSWKRPAHDTFGIVSVRNKTGGLDWTHTESEGTWVTLPEYREMVKEGYQPIIKTDDSMRTPICAILCARLPYNPHEITKTWYQKREEMKKAKNKGQYVLKVLTSSSAFGKFAEQNQSEIIVDEATFACQMSDEWSFSKVENGSGDNGGWGIAKKNDMERSDTSMFLMAAYITAYARLSLYRTAKSVGFEHVIYMDTDSLKHTNASFDTSKPQCDYNGKPMDLMGTGLGQWKTEQKYDYWCSTKPKQYKYHAVWDEDAGACDKWVLRIKGVSVAKAYEHHTGLKIADDPKKYQKWLEAQPLTGKFSYPQVLSIKQGTRKNAARKPTAPKKLHKKDGSPTQAALDYEKKMEKWNERPNIGQWVVVEKEV
jgi:hypothetical protein